MTDDFNHEYDRFIEPLLSDEAIWNSEHRFMEEIVKLMFTLIHDGYSDEYIQDVTRELTKRWLLLIEERYGKKYRT